MRVQLSRRAGWRKPPNTIVVARPSRWGNPFTVEKYGSDEAVRLHRAWLLAQPELVEQARSDLAGRHLACWCKPDQPCHADTLIEIANSAGTPDATNQHASTTHAV